MEILSFRIKNYRSIKDSGECHLSGDNITILAGKNEAGKTAILEALEDFNDNRPIRDEAKPLHDTDAVPEIAIKFEVDKEILDEIKNEIGIKLEPTGSISIEFIKKYPKDYTYRIPRSSREKLGLEKLSLPKKQQQINKNYDQAKNIYTAFTATNIAMPQIDLENSETSLARFTDFKRNIEPILAQQNESSRSDFTDTLENLISGLTELVEAKSTEEKFIHELMTKWIPNFILFSTFEDVFPSEIPFTEASSNQLVKDLDIISDLNLDLIKSGSSPQKATHKKKLNIRVSESYRKFWEQDLTNLSIDWESDKLIFHITEGDDFYPPKMRSKGKQWHLAFYIRVTARAKEDVANVILIDEPGLYLHARAQKDVLRKLEDCANETEVIFSTHSPYLIDINKLARIRLVSRSVEDGTTISDKIHKGADEDTLTPIITAIGLDLSLGLDIAKNNNIIFEGITDYYYVTAFQQLLQFKFSQEVHFIPSAGADKTAILASLMIGWGLNFCIVLDNDSKGRQTEARLLKDFTENTIKLIKISENTDEEIEDLFTREDFIACVLKEDSSSIPPDKRNSQIIKQKDRKYDKVLLSKLFLENLQSGKIKISTETKQNFKETLQKINNSLFPKAQTTSKNGN
jgi:predicted ATP-dependent endonuclease of OLD family